MNTLPRTLALVTLPVLASAGDGPYSLTANVGLVSDYYFRGLTQTWHDPALQGGADLSHSSGLYAGLWGSSVSGNQYPNGSGLELDYYFGYNGKISDDFGWTVGGYGYFYPGAETNTVPAEKFNTFEVNVGLSYKWLSAKYSHTTTDWFGANTITGYDGGTKGSGYLELNAAIPLGNDFTLGMHVGHTNVAGKLLAPLPSGATNPDYTDYKLSVSKGFSDGWNTSLAYVKSTNGRFWDRTASAMNAADLEDLGDGRLVVYAGRSF